MTSTDDPFLKTKFYSDDKFGPYQVVVVNRTGEIILRFVGTSKKDALKRAKTFIDIALEEKKKPREE